MLSNGLEVAMVAHVSKFLLPALRWEERPGFDVTLRKEAPAGKPGFRAGVVGPAASQEKQRTVVVGPALWPLQSHSLVVTRSDHMHTLLTHYPPPRNKALNRNKDTPTILELSEEAA